eukprot:g5703.t1
MSALFSEFRHQFRKTLNSFRWNLAPPTVDKVLYDFRLFGDDKNPSREMEQKQRLVDSFLVSSDVTIGGTSTATFEQLENGGAVFSGNLSLVRNGERVDKAYAAIRATIPRELGNCEDYEGIGLRIKADSNLYTLNVTAQSFFPDDLHQGYLKVEGDDVGEWLNVELPFENLLLTSYGYEKTMGRPVDASRLKTIGFTVVGGEKEEGPFRLEIESIKALVEMDKGAKTRHNDKLLDSEREERIRRSVARQKYIEGRDKEERVGSSQAVGTAVSRWIQGGGITPVMESSTPSGSQNLFENKNEDEENISILRNKGIEPHPFSSAAATSRSGFRKEKRKKIEGKQVEGKNEVKLEEENKNMENEKQNINWMKKTEGKWK